MMEFFISYYTICFMFLIGYIIQDDIHHGVTRWTEYLIDVISAIILAPFLPVLIGVRISNTEQEEL